MELKIPRTFITLVAVFVTSLVTANVLATKLFMFGDFILPAGVIAYPITFLMTDVIGEIWGKKVVTRVVWARFFCSLLAMSLGFIAVMLPAAPFYERQEFFTELFGRVGRITGCINGQREWVTSQPGIIKVNEDSSDPVWLDSGEPSKFVMLLQKKFGLSETGCFDQDLWHMFEVRYGKHIDNWIDSPSETVAAWQNELNAGSFFN